MKNKLLLSCLSFALLGFSGCEYIEDLNPAQGNRDYTTFTVRVENVSQPQTLSVERLDGIVPLSPGAFAVYPGNLYLGTNPMFLPGTPADGGTELIAEDGFPMQEAQLLKDYSAVRMSGTFDSPGGPGNTPALLKLMYLSWHITNPKEPDEKIAGIKMVVNTFFSYHRT